MRSALVVCVTIFMYTMTFSHADFAAAPVCLNFFTQEFPDLSGETAVWQDNRNGAANWDIFGYLFNEPNEIPICTAAGSQKNPAVSGSIVVWQDESLGSSNRNIYGFDLDSRTPFEVCIAAGSQQNPDVSQGVIVWQDNRNGSQDIYGYDLSLPEGSREFVIADGSASQMYPAIDYPWVAWTDNRNGNYDIYAKNLATGQEIPVCTAAGDQFYPAVCGARVVWQDHRDYSSNGTDVYGRTLPDGLEQAICAELKDQMNPVVSGSLVAWEDYRNGAESDVFVLDLETGIVLEAATGIGNQKQPAADGRWVIWNGSGDIYRGTPPAATVVTVLNPNGGEMLAAGSPIEILWQTQGGDPDLMRVSLSVNGGSSWIEVVPQTPNTGSFPWTLPADLNSTQCLVRVSDADRPSVSDVSDAAFTVYPCSPALTADLSGDCRVDLADAAILAGQWLLCGNPYDAGCIE